MDLKGLLLAGAIVIVSADAGADSGSSLHPAEPTGSLHDSPHPSAFADAIPLLDRDAPAPSYGPMPPGADPSAEPTQASGADMPAMGHGSMGHGGMDHGSMHHGSMGHGTMTGGPTDGGSTDHGTMDHDAMGRDAMGHGTPSPSN